MLSWKTTRIICTVLLLMPVVHLAYLVSREALATLNPSPDVWSKELSAYTRADRNRELPSRPVVVVGGRRVNLWRSLDELLDEPVLMRGLGDAIVEDITYNFNALIGFYRPGAVVLLPGNSEFHIRDNKSADELLAAIQELEALDAAREDTGRFYVFAPIKTPLYPGDYVKIDRAIELLTSWASSKNRVEVLDGNTMLADDHGQPRARYFLNDGINLNEHGYLRLAVLLESALAAEAPGTAGNTTGS